MSNSFNSNTLTDSTIPNKQKTLTHSHSSLSNCEYHQLAIELCNDHAIHSHDVIEFTGTPTALIDALDNKNVQSITVCEDNTGVCEWSGCCSLDYVSHDDKHILVKDKKANRYSVPILSVIAFNDKDEGVTI